MSSITRTPSPTAPTTTGARPSSSPASLRRRNTIIDATRALLREREPDDIVVADVAALAGVSVATVYNLVGTRDQLLMSVLDSSIDGVGQLLPDRAGDDPIEALIAVSTTAVDVVLADPGLHRRALASLGRLSSDLWLEQGLDGHFLSRMEACAAAGCFRPEIDPAAAVVPFQLAFRGALISWVFGRLSADELRARTELMACQILVNLTEAPLAARLRDRADRLMVLDDPSG